MFDNRLSKLREELGYNKKEAAEALNMPYTTYLNYENNEREPNSETLIQIAKFYNVSVDYLLGISTVKSPVVEIKRICQYTGLSNDAVDILNKNKNYDTRLLDVINFLIENEYRCDANYFESILSQPDIDKKYYEKLYNLAIEREKECFHLITTLSEYFSINVSENESFMITDSDIVDKRKETTPRIKELFLQLKKVSPKDIVDSIYLLELQQILKKIKELYISKLPNVQSN